MVKTLIMRFQCLILATLIYNFIKFVVSRLFASIYGGTRLESIFLVFQCISLELQVRTGSNLETRYRYHPRSPKKNSLQVRSAIMAVMVGGILPKLMVFSTDLAHFLYQVYNSPHTFCLDLIFTVQPSPVLW